jgi:hypothetical protein
MNIEHTMKKLKEMGIEVMEVNEKDIDEDADADAEKLSVFLTFRNEKKEISEDLGIKFVLNDYVYTTVNESTFENLVIILEDQIKLCLKSKLKNIIDRIRNEELK